jgi:hypothetical protein
MQANLSRSLGGHERFKEVELVRLSEHGRVHVSFSCQYILE